MKRRTQKPSYGVAAIKYDAEKVIGEATLQAIGEIVILWNTIEYELDEAIQAAIRLPSDVTTSVRSRISGLEAKADILKECLEPMLYFQGRERELLADTLGDFMTLKSYRDNLVHMRLVGSPKKIQAFTPEKRGARYELPFSRQLVVGVARRMRIFRDEMRLFTWIINLRLMILNSENVRRLTYDPEEWRGVAETTARKEFVRLQGCRKKRQALRPLPEFREEDPPPASWELKMRSEMRLHAESILKAARDAADKKLARLQLRRSSRARHPSA